ncbi:MAG: PEP-CTERM sorting domain-containing protein [Candidatus Nealsonbacteria bacterium]|nr:PEP-CTERM sorting domain-containing protein [Candidatus Nealsonbacteria bacterium]
MRTFRVCAPGFAALTVPVVALLLVAAAQAGVVVHYEFENNLLDTGADGIIADNLIGYDVDGEMTPTFAPGIVGQAVNVSQVAGQAAVLQALDSDELDLAANWTVEAFVKPDFANLNHWDRFATKWFDGSTEWHWTFSNVNNGQDLFLNGANAIDGLGTGTVPLNQWSHVAMTGDSNDVDEGIKLWQNGVVVGVAVPYQAVTPGASNFRIGNWDASAGQAPSQFSGLVDEFMIHNDAKDAAYMATRAVLVPEPPLPQAGLATFYPFEGENAMRTVDAAADYAESTSTYNDDLSIVGQVDFVAGMVGQTARLQGGYFVGLHTSDVELPADFTIEAWINPDNPASTWQRLVLNWDGVGQNAYHFTLHNGAVSLFITEEDEDPLFEVAVGGTVVANQWQHVAAVLDSTDGTGTVYLDGQPVGSGPFDGTLFTSPSAGLGLGDSFGQPNATMRYSGLIDEVALWSTALSADDILAHFDSGAAGYGLTRLGLRWDGEVDTNWATLGNWDDNAAVPDADTAAIVDNGGALNVSTAAPGEFARDLFIDDGSVSVAATAVLSVTDELAVAATGSLTVADGATLNAARVNTSGATTFAPGSLGTIGTLTVTAGTANVADATVTTLNVNGGTANVVGTTVTTLNVTAGTLGATVDVAALNVDGGTVNVTGASSAGQFNLNDGAVTMAADLDVTTASLQGGMLDTGANRLVVHEELTVLGYVKFGIDAAHSFAATTSNPWLSNDLTLSGGEFTINSLTGGTPVVPTGGLVSQWRFEDPADLGYDSATPDRTRTTTGTPAHTAEGRFGGALLLDGNSHIETSTEGFQQAYSVSAWLTVDEVVGLTQWRTAAGSWEADSMWMHLGKDASGDLFSDYGGTPASPTIATEAFSRDIWHHVVSIRDGMENQLWVDGEMVATSSSDLPPPPDPAFLIGAKDLAGGNHWIGMIDELYVYDRALTPDDVAQLYEPSVVGVELQLETVNLTVTEDTQVAADAEAVTLGNLSVVDGVNSLALGGAVYSFQDVSFAGNVTLDGELEVRTVLDMGDGAVGTLTLGDGELVLGPDATYHAELSVAGQVGNADTIVLAGSDSGLMLDGELKISSISDRDANDSWSEQPVTIVDNKAGEGSIGWLDQTDPQNPVMRNNQFDTVTPEDGTHLGHGAFLRGVDYNRAGNVTTSVDLDVLIALGGDADGDGKVWLSDWAALRANFGNTGTGKTWTEGNFDPWEDDKVWLSDWAALRANFGNASYTAPAAAAVPEPGTIVMLLGAVAAFAWAVRRR